MAAVDDLLGRDAREPLGDLPPSLAIELLRQIDAALDNDDLPAALAFERMLPSTLGAEPAVVDRLVTLRLREDDVATAAAGLGACAPDETPRLRLLRTVVAIRCPDSRHPVTATGVETGTNGEEIGLIERVLDRLLASASGTVPHCGDRSPATDPTAALCALVAGKPRPVATLSAALGVLDRLLSGQNGPPVGSVAAAVVETLHGVARDLDISLRLAPPSGELAVTPSDRARLRLRAA